MPGESYPAWAAARGRNVGHVHPRLGSRACERSPQWRARPDGPAHTTARPAGTKGTRRPGRGISSRERRRAAGICGRPAAGRSRPGPPRQVPPMCRPPWIGRRAAGARDGGSGGRSPGARRHRRCSWALRASSSCPSPVPRSRWRCGHLRTSRVLRGPPRPAPVGSSVPGRAAGRRTIPHPHPHPHPRTPRPAEQRRRSRRSLRMWQRRRRPPLPALPPGRC